MMKRGTLTRGFPRLHLAIAVGFMIGVAVLSFHAFSLRFQERLALDLRLIALSIPPEDLEGLALAPAGGVAASYRQVRALLENILKVDERYKYAYIFELRDGEEVALACTPAAPGTPPIGPGTVLGVSDPEEERFFAGARESIWFRQYRDDWGHWVSVAVPALLDPGTGAVRMALGLDLAYMGWLTKVSTATGAVVLIAFSLIALAMLVVDRTRRLRASLESLAAEERKKKESAEASERAERDFLALMSHEIRNPLSAIVGFSRLLSETRLDGEQRGHVDMLRSSSDHLMDLVNDILDFSKIEAGRMDIHPRPFSPGLLAEGVVSLFSLQALKKGIDLRLEDEGTCPPFLLGDEVRVRQILVNLVSNAIKFTERGEVALRLAYAADTGGCGILSLAVADTGPGMDAETLARLFMPFRQGSGSSRGGGTGLGLVISKRLVDLMGGGISAGTDLGKGSVFSVTLPLPACEAPGEAIEELKPPLSGLRILVADDDAANRALVSTLLARRGASVSPAADGKEALAALLAGLHTGGLDAPVLDRSMPGLLGTEVARELRSAEAVGSLPRLRLVALTASVSEEGRRELLAAGFDEVLPKPFDPDRLAEALLPGEAGRRGSADPSRQPTPAPAVPPGAARPTVPAIVEESALIERVEGDEELAAILVASFLDTLAETIAGGRSALDAGDFAGLRAAAHKLRGGALNACAVAVARAAAELEEACAAGDAPRAAAGLAAVEDFRLPQ